MLWSRFIFMLLLALVSARPSPELSLEEIEKELEQLTAQESDSSETKKTSDQEDSSKNTQPEAPKELTDKAREVSLEKLEALEKSVTNTEQKKDETERTEAETEKKTTDTSADAAMLPKKSAKPVPEELTYRDTTDADIKGDLSTRGLPKLSFKDTGAYRRLMETRDPRLPSLPKLRSDDYKYGYPSLPKPHYFPEAPARRTYGGDYKYGLPSKRKPYFPEAPIRRTYEGSYMYRKAYDDPPHDSSSWNRRGFLPNSDPIEALKRVPSGKTLI
ncbi:uncharacterized protein LOC110052068 [Orbicella faveolata]|uniref:uncharacterized protein LOC110052068 n=1 Tax=Orbicella faveolata TaxID=48498 RepID=UPI0009E42D4A|nr:uncharacterized protein LOC110052068 [Orbicella faveolata]